MGIIKRQIVKSRLKYIVLFLSQLCMTLGWARSDTPKNIILLIGDGMGVAHVTAAKTVGGSLNMERFKTAGLVTTHPANNYITDSAAGATAMATGQSTSTGTISISPHGDTLKTVLEVAEEKGLSTGLVSTSRVTHATPAAFASHVDRRAKQAEIAVQLTKAGLEVLFGGGRDFFIPQTDSASQRVDNLNLVQILEQDYTVIFTKHELVNLSSKGPVIGFFADKYLPAVGQRDISLPEMTSKALQILSSNPNGFFLMCEGSQIDWAGHDNDFPYLVGETIDFDNAVGVVLDYAEKREDTLVIVTADHETGGLTLIQGSIADQKVTVPNFSTSSHTGVMVPIFAFGPGSHRFGGILDNTDIGKILIEFVQGE